MNVVIVEDEPLAIEKLERYLQKFSFSIDIIARHNSIGAAVPWFLDNQADVDIIFMDIQLVDGLSFEIFSKVKIIKPVIFITAFDEYAIDAFKVNSIDYLLKPITFTSLSNALEKFRTLKDNFRAPEGLGPVFRNLKKKGYKSRFLVKKGRHIQSILTAEVAFFYAEGRDIFLVHRGGSKFLIEYKLESICGFVSEMEFYRINRSMIVNILSIKDVIVHSNRRLKLILEPAFAKEVIVSREKVSEFKKWFEGEK